MTLFKNGTKSEEIEAKLEAFDQKTAELREQRENLMQQKSTALAREGAGDESASQEIQNVRKKLREVDEELEGRDSAREQLQQAYRETRKKEEMDGAESVRKELEEKTLRSFEDALSKVEKAASPLLKNLSEMRSEGARLTIGSSYDRLNAGELVRNAIEDAVQTMKYETAPERPLEQLRERLSGVREQVRQAPAAEFERRKQKIENRYGTGE